MYQETDSDNKIFSKDVLWKHRSCINQEFRNRFFAKCVLLLCTKDWPGKKVTIPLSIFLMVKSSEKILFVVVILKMTTLFERNEDRVTGFLK